MPMKSGQVAIFLSVWKAVYTDAKNARNPLTPGVYTLTRIKTPRAMTKLLLTIARAPTRARMGVSATTAQGMTT
jgi:hypothetical protein